MSFWGPGGCDCWGRAGVARGGSGQRNTQKTPHMQADNPKLLLHTLFPRIRRATFHKIRLTAFVFFHSIRWFVPSDPFIIKPHFALLPWLLWKTHTDRSRRSRHARRIKGIYFYPALSGFVHPSPTPTIIHYRPSMKSWRTRFPLPNGETQTDGCLLFILIIH